MASNQMFMSPRVDLTIRNLTVEQVEAISKSAVDIIGGRVSFSESAIYESEPEDPGPIVDVRFCDFKRLHPHHGWMLDGVHFACPGKNIIG